MPDTPEVTSKAGDAEALKPCPWEPSEGGHVVAADAWESGMRCWSARVRCVICGAQGPMVRGHSTRDDAEFAARAAWNNWGEKKDG